MLSRFTLFPSQASTMAPRVDSLFGFLVALTTFFTLLIAGLILYFMVKYRRRPGDPTPAGVHGSYALEIAWTVIPFGITMLLFFWGASIYASLFRPPPNALVVHAVGRQWMWKMQHLEGRREINELHVPVGRPVKVVLTSEDVIHDFFVPAFRTKMDVIPGRYTQLWFEASQPGEYHLFCSQYCGTLHAQMIGRVVAMEPAAFEAWLSGAEPGQTGVSMAQAGERLFQANGCATCHAGGEGQRGPTLAGLPGTTVHLADGRSVVADDDYLRESILNPQAKVVAGFQPIMPTFQGLLGEEDIMQIVTYLKTLGPPRERP